MPSEDAKYGVFYKKNTKILKWKYFLSLIFLENPFS